jgi:hypothetical protein
MNTTQSTRDLSMSDTTDRYKTRSEEYLERQKKIEEELRPAHSSRVLDFLYDRCEYLAPSVAYKTLGRQPAPGVWVESQLSASSHG